MLIKETSDMTDIERQTIHNQNNSYLEIGIQKVLDDGYNIDELKLNGKFAILNATGTLPSVYSADDNNFFVECYMWFEHYGRQVLHDVRTNKTFTRNLLNDEWQPFEFVDRIVEQGETTVDGIKWTWEKWSSGKAVCWGTKFWELSRTGNYWWGDISLPFTFYKPANSLNDFCITLCGGTNHTGALYTDSTALYSTSTVTVINTASDYVEEAHDVVVHYHIIGKWK